MWLDPCLILSQVRLFSTHNRTDRLRHIVTVSAMLTQVSEGDDRALLVVLELEPAGAGVWQSDKSREPATPVDE